MKSQTPHLILKQGIYRKKRIIKINFMNIRSPVVENYSSQQSRNNSQLIAKQYSSPNLDKIPFPVAIPVNKYIPTSAQSPAPIVNISTKSK
jgi:hypothetical protein